MLTDHAPVASRCCSSSRSSTSRQTIYTRLYRHVYMHVFRHVNRHVYRHVYKHVYRHVCKHIYRRLEDGIAPSCSTVRYRGYGGCRGGSTLCDSCCSADAYVDTATYDTYASALHMCSDICSADTYSVPDPYAVPMHFIAMYMHCGAMRCAFHLLRCMHVHAHAHVCGYVDMNRADSGH